MQQKKENIAFFIYLFNHKNAIRDIVVDIVNVSKKIPIFDFVIL